MVPLWWVLCLCGHSEVTVVATAMPLWYHCGHSEVNMVATVVTVVVSQWRYCVTVVLL